MARLPRKALLSVIRETLSGVRVLLPFHALVALYSTGVLLMAFTLGKSGSLAYTHYLERLAPVYLIAMPPVAILIFCITVFVRTDDWASRRNAVADALSSAAIGRYASGLLALMTFTLFLGSFTTLKNLMPDLMGGFQYDEIQADIDRILHFGRDPGPLLVALLDTWPLRRAIEWNYGVLWSMLGMLPIFFIAMSKTADRIRLRYFLAMFFTWTVAGSLLACLFLSAGPAFYGHVTGDAARFAPVLDALASTADATASAASFQAYLWQNYASGTSAIGTGISAFPSVHVALTMMHALFLWDKARIAGLFGMAYVAVTIVSSVYLGWHYAIDGYVSIAVVLVLHVALKRALRAGAGETLTPHPSPATA
jgi:cytochrome c oxidase subunit IV